jgi:hypothetical protein
MDGWRLAPLAGVEVEQAVPRSPALLLLALAALALGASPISSRAASIPMASFEDAEGDATGPGGLVPPTDPSYQDGDFDLRRVAVLVDGQDVLFVVTLGAAVRPSPAAQQAGLALGQPGSGLFLQNIDIYIDTDRTPGSGSSACLPGRRVAFADGRTWEAAVVLTPQPDLARAVAREALGPVADRIVFPQQLTVRGRTITARVPAALLGGTPRAGWGYSVQVSGARWAPDASGDHRWSPGTHELDAFTMPVLAQGGPFAFGGAPAGEAHPRVVDVLLPAGVDQASVLGGFDAAGGKFARVPFLQAIDPSLASEPVAPALAAAAAAAPPAPAAAAPAASSATPTTAPAPASTPAPVFDAARPVLLAPNLMPRLTPAPASPGGVGSDAEPTKGARVALVVLEVTDDLISARGSVAGLQAMQFGRVVDAQGITVARVMILRLQEKGVLASAIAGKERIKPGALMLFDAGASAPSAP